MFGQSPNSSAAGSHMMSLLRLFKAQDWRVVFATPAQKTEHMVDLPEEAIESVEITLNDESFDHFVTDLGPDYVMFDRFMMEEQFAWRVEKNCPQAIRILDTEDLQSLRNARQTALKENRQLCESDYSNDLAKREIAAIWRSDLSLIISDFEMDLLQTHYGLQESLLINIPFLLSQETINSPRARFQITSAFCHHRKL